MGAMDNLKIVLFIQLFYALSITLVAYALPADNLNYLTSFSDPADDINLQTASQDVQASLDSQTSLPIVELGALVFFSGNIVLDLLLNFITAIPQMVAMLVNGLLMLINVDSYIAMQIQLFATAIIGMIYLIGLIQFVLGVRSGRTIT